jgi:hypothetical protein
VTDVGLSDAVSPVAGETDAVSDVVPEKPLTAVTVTVEVPEELTRIERLVGLAATVKSWTTVFTVTVTLCESEPLVPVTVTLPETEPLTVSVAVPEPVTLVGLRVAVSPAVALAVRLTVPANPLMPVMVMVEVAELEVPQD